MAQSNYQQQLASHRAKDTALAEDKTKNTLDELLRKKTSVNPVKITDKKLEGII